MRVAIVGAGAIGLTHCETIAATEGFELAGIADPFDSGAALAERFGTAHYRDHRDLLASERPDGVIVATPNELHVSIALDCLAARVPALVEKPLAGSVAEAEALVAAERCAGVPVLVGHHRRHHPFIQRAREIVASGAIGRLAGVSASYCLSKPDDYFEATWRRTAGAGGPFLINLIHEIDLLRFVCGEIVSVAAFASNAVRGFEVEDTGAVIFAFEAGALASLVVSDTAAGPWSWDLASGDVPRFPKHDVDSHRFLGTEGAVTLPRLQLWRHDGPRSWTTPLVMTRDGTEREDPFVRQLLHFREVAERRVAPLVGALEGARNMAVLEAVRRSAATGARVEVGRIGVAAAVSAEG
jgi:predicted dehydrogenase